MYVVVWNRATAQREEFLILGGARVDTPNATGIFHTGAKKAIVAFHLKGLQVIVASSDDRGPYTYRVHHRPTNVGDVVLGIYNQGEEGEQVRECTYTTAIADNAWLAPMNGNPFVRAFGQFLLNAVGTSPEEWGILLNQEEVEFVPGTTRVYIPQGEEVLDIVEHLETYFTWGKIPLAEQVVTLDDNRKITVQVFRRPEGEHDGQTVIYHSGMVAYWEDPVRRPYRWAYNIAGDLRGKYLSEERHLRSISKTRSLIASAYARAIRSGNTKMIECLIDAMTSGEGELEIWAHHRKLAEIFWDRHGKRACMVGEQMLAMVASRLKRPVVGVASGGLIWSLENSGVDKATDAGPIKGGREEKPLTKRQQQKVNRAVGILQQAGLASTGRPVGYVSFTNIDPNADTVGFRESGATDRIGIREDVLADSKELLETLVHEHRHLLTDVGDTHSAFVNRADADLARLAMALHGKRE